MTDDTNAATSAPAVDAECQLCHGLNTSCPNGCEIIHDAVDAVPAGEGYTREQINSALRTARSNAIETFGIRWAHLEEISRIELTLSALASLSHGEGRK